MGCDVSKAFDSGVQSGLEAEAFSEGCTRA